MRYALSIAALFLLHAAGCGQSGGVEDLAASRPAGETVAKAQEVNMPAATQPSGIHRFVMKDIDGQLKSLADYQGKVLLVVNVASKCGYTKQYSGLEALYRKYRDKGLVVLGFPSNDFGKQEPGTEAEIKEFCSTRFDVTFPLMSKSSVKNGPEQNEIYRYLTRKSENGRLDAEVKWNFNKFLVDRDGQVVKYYESKVAPDSPELISDIEAALQG